MGRKLTAAICGVIMAIAMTFTSFAGVYGNSNQECFYNQEWRAAFTNYANQVLGGDGRTVKVFWIENEADHSGDKVVALVNQTTSRETAAWTDSGFVYYPDGTIYDSMYKHTDDFTYSDENEYVNWRSKSRHFKDYNEFSKYAPQQ